MTFITWEQRKKLFDELRTAENSAVVRINTGHSNLENELRELEEKIRNRNIVLENVVRERETAQLEKHPKKTINVRKEKDALSKQISALREAAEKMESEVAYLSTECEQRKEEKDMKVKEIKEIWDAHVQAMHIYKKKTKIYLDINEEDGNSFTVYFFQTDKESGSEYTVKLKRKQDLNQKVWESKYTLSPRPVKRDQRSLYNPEEI